MAAAHGAVPALTVGLCVLLLLPAASGLQSEGQVCAFTDHLRGPEPQGGPASELRGVVQQNGTVRCSRGSRCYGLWEKRGDGEIRLVKQGCWTHIGDQQECLGDRCLVTATPSQIQNGSYRFCCCSRAMCNSNFTEAPPTADTPALRMMKPSGQNEQQTDHQPLRREVMALIALVTVAIAAILIVVLFLGYRMIRGKQKLGLSALDVMEAANCESAVDLDHLKLLEPIGRGRYGTVYRGCLSDCCVAVKLFGSTHRQNYVTERSIYRLPLLQHDNVAHFLAADERTACDGRPEFLILLEYYPHGCLSRYLSVHTVDWSTCCRMTHGLTRGLAFLHTELYRGDQYKPAVAHRDVTSGNVLVRADLSCVLADFGLSMKLTGNRPCGYGDNDAVAISEVGTVRYMAPEVLGGALNLRDCEAALKQVDVYALGLLYWESFRRCRDLFPGAVAPEYQLAFQAELGNHPSFEEMQILVVREKHRPRFPEAWKENSLALRSLKETMEDCWDQDAEARLTAQCAEERLSELTLLSTHTAVHNHRNLAHGRWAPQSGSTSCYIEDLQVDMVRNLQGEGHLTFVLKTTKGRPGGAEKNRNSINYERQQARLSSSDNSMSATTAVTPAPTPCTVSESEHSGGAVSGISVCLQLTEEDLEATKLNPKEINKNLRESSDENLLEHSQKQFGSEPQSTSLLYHHILQTTEVNDVVSSPPTGPGVDAPPSASIHALPKQQNLPQRPTSLHLTPKTEQTTAAFVQLKLAKLNSNHRQVETGVAKMNTVTVAMAAEPHVATTVINNTAVVSVGYSSGVPTLVTKGMRGGGRTNLAGPQMEEEGDKMDGEMAREEETRLNLFNFSPDEHEPLLRRDQLPVESKPLHHLKGRGSNSNNNNNRTGLGSQVKIRDLEVKPQSIGGISPKSGQNVTSLQISRSVAIAALTTIENKFQLSGPVALASDTCLQKAHTAGPALASRNIQSPKIDVVPRYDDPDPDLTKAQEAPGTPASQEQQPGPETTMSDLLTLKQKPSTTVVSDVAAPLSDPKAAGGNPETSPLDSPASEAPVVDLEPKAPPTPAFLHISAELRNPDPESSHETQAKVRRPERPCSLDLSSSCMSTDDLSLDDKRSLSASGEKIKRRVKTPYTLKKWRPASWVVSTDTALDSDFDTSGSSSQIQFSSSLQRAGGSGICRINQSKSSMAVFLVGGGATATTTSEPNGMTCF